MNTDFKGLKTLKLKNFRSWKEGFVEFIPGVNVITGDNDVGKSAILGALDLVINNRPLGDDYRSHWGGDTDVILEIEDKLVGRHKTNNDNVYTLSHANGQEDVFRAFRAKVPEQILEFLNFKPINIHSQFEGVFLLGQSPADVARYYNDIVHLDIIDRSISNINSILREEKGQLRIQEKEEERISSQLKEFDWLDDAESGLIRLEKAQTNIRKEEDEFSLLSQMINTLKDLSDEFSFVEQMTRHEKRVTFLQTNLGISEKLKIERKELALLIETLTRLQEQEIRFTVTVRFEKRTHSLIDLKGSIERGSAEYDVLESLEKILLSLNDEEEKLQGKIRYEGQMVRLLILDQKIEQETEQHNGLFDFREQMAMLGNEYQKGERERERLEGEFSRLMPAVCPLCGQKVECEHK